MIKRLAYTASALCAAIVMSIAGGCSASGCYENHSAIPLAEFYSDSSNDAIYIDNINVGGVNAPNDSLLIESGNRASEVYFPFRFNTTETSFFIEYTSEGVPAGEDVITFKYTPIPFFAGEACGALYNYKINEVVFTDNLLKRVELVDSLITNLNRVYIKLYFATSEDDSKEDPIPTDPPAL